MFILIFVIDYTTSLCYNQYINKRMRVKMSTLNNKKVIFIGDSFIFYGGVVNRIGCETLEYDARTCDEGLFYKLCKSKGDNVSVVNWTFGGHGLRSIFADECPLMKDCHGKSHMSYLEDKYYDYVIVSGGRRENCNKTFFEDINKVYTFFKEANPNVKFVYLVSSGAHNVSVEPTFAKTILNGLKEIEKLGFIIVDWGSLIKDIIFGVHKPTTNTEYNKNTFVVARTERDGFHPNILAGYISALMTYSAITESSAIGSVFDFCDTLPSSIKEYRELYYQNGETTNFPEILNSSEDMLWLQESIDKYLADKKFRNYNFEE